MAVSGRKLDYPSKITDSRKVIRSRKSKIDKQYKEKKKKYTKGQTMIYKKLHRKL